MRQDANWIKRVHPSDKKIGYCVLHHAVPLYRKTLFWQFCFPIRSPQPICSAWIFVLRMCSQIILAIFIMLLMQQQYIFHEFKAYGTTLQCIYGISWFIIIQGARFKFLFRPRQLKLSSCSTANPFLFSGKPISCGFCRKETPRLMFSEIAPRSFWTL